MAYVRDLGSADLWRYSEERSRRRRAARARQRRMRRIGVPLAMLVTASGTAGTAFAGSSKAADGGRRSAARRAHQRILRIHATGPDVARLQRLLGVPVDGVFGHGTLAAVKRFQRASHLLVDGQVGPHTWAALLAQDRGLSGELVLRVGSTGAAVADMQRRLGIPADGIFGPITLAAVKAFQRSHGLVVDGQAGQFTLGALHSAGFWQAPAFAPPAAASRPSRSHHTHHRRHRHERSPAHRHHHRNHRPASPGPSLGERAVHVAEGYLGVPYVWGGESPAGFDCSGLVQYVYLRLGVSLPRTSYAQYNAGRRITRSELEPGDLVFFDGAGHVGIYVGGGRFIHSPHTGTSVQFGELSGWYLANYTGAVRVTS
ncbi:MAG: C40 family peptidase [Gaiellales bacterium]